MNLHVFVDESPRGSQYLLAAALLRPGDLASTRALMRSLTVAGARKVHFKHERDSIKKDIVAALVSARARARVYLGCGEPETVGELVLRALVTDLAWAGMRRIVLDSRGQERDQVDRRIIRSTLVAAGIDTETVTYEHLQSHEDPALWVADAVAWCHGAGGDWRRRIGPMVESVVDLGPADRRSSTR
ncbi:MAG TPA: hypothetical protein VGX25_18990 [Actinophytocola sp.]|uniref:hypothetical protein n=1 Tax=Actinophytocola sp. TaxID=1872138 RepID=UPI002DDD20D8|nr:hypothetical protein [Actinophytocola sp.]HEV2781473.1 hypothetical protein [Actinophytocola sp.]